MQDTTQPLPNIPLLRKAVEWAEAEDAKTDGTGLWNQLLYASPRECGTAFCIAGYALSIQPGFSLDADKFPKIDGKYVGWSNSAEKILGLTGGEAFELFDANNDIADVRRVAEQIAARAGDRL